MSGVVDESSGLPKETLDRLTLLASEVERLRRALTQVRLDSLLRIRRAAFTPEIGVRYTEKIRLDIADECHRLEVFIDDTLAAPVRPAT